jgi:hypothetical protein
MISGMVGHRRIISKQSDTVSLAPAQDQKKGTFISSTIVENIKK